MPRASHQARVLIPFLCIFRIRNGFKYLIHLPLLHFKFIILITILYIYQQWKFKHYLICYCHVDSFLIIVTWNLCDYPFFKVSVKNVCLCMWLGNLCLSKSSGKWYIVYWLDQEEIGLKRLLSKDKSSIVWIVKQWPTFGLSSVFSDSSRGNQLHPFWKTFCFIKLMIPISSM